LKDLKIEDKIFVKIIDLENKEGYIELSLSKAGKELAWEELKQKKEKDEILSVKILGANKGGLLAKISGIPAFLPVSQLSAANYPKVEDGRVFSYQYKSTEGGRDYKIHVELERKEEDSYGSLNASALKHDGLK